MENKAMVYFFKKTLNSIDMLILRMILIKSLISDEKAEAKVEKRI